MNIKTFDRIHQIMIAPLFIVPICVRVFFDGSKAAGVGFFLTSIMVLMAFFRGYKYRRIVVPTQNENVIESNNRSTFQFLMYTYLICGIMILLTSVLLTFDIRLRQ